MSLSSPFVLVGVAFLLAILVISFYARHLATRDLRLFKELAKKRKGKVKIDSFTSWATTLFKDDGYEVTVYQQKGLSGKRERTCVKTLADIPDHISVHIAGADSKDSSVLERGQWFLVPAVQIGSDAFNKEFVIHGNDSDFLEDLFSEDLQKQFLSLRSKSPVLYLHTQKPVVYEKKGKVLKHLIEFSIRDVPSSVDELDKIIDLGLKIIRILLSAVPKK